MSFQIPRRVPAFDSTQREIEDGYWRAATTNSHAGENSGLDLTGKIGNFINPSRDLPMYKDKPYYSSRRSGPATRRRRKWLWLTICVVFLVSLWWFLGGESADRIKAHGMNNMHGGDLWKWIQSFDMKGAASFGGAGEEEKGVVDWEERRQKVKDAFVVSWDGYREHAYGQDVYKPLTKTSKNMVPGGMGWIIVDSLDTLILMNLTSQVQEAREWIQTDLRYDQDKPVNTFETTIRMLGGLLSAHYMSTTYPDLAPLPKDDNEVSSNDDLYIEKATDLADRLLGAFDSPSGVPYASVNLNKTVGIPSHSDKGASSTAEAATVQLEFKYLAKLTGEPNYWETVEKVMEVIEQNGMEDGLLPIFIHADTGKFKGENIRLGSRGDSYYEYLIKQYLQTSSEEPIYQNMWNEALAGIRKHLLAYTKHASLTVLGERQNGLNQPLAPKMDHLVCFLPGTIALGATGGLPLSEARKAQGWGRQQEEEILLSKELMKTCWATYLATATGLAPEITHFQLDDPPRMVKDGPPGEPKKENETKEEKKKRKQKEKMLKKDKKAKQDLPMVSKPLYPLDDKESAWRKDIIIKPADRHNLQRPETVESLLYMYRITGDEIYRHWGWEMFKNFVKHTAVIDENGDDAGDDKSKSDSDQAYIRAFTSLTNADTVPAVQSNNMESFWLAETLKYFYLLFSDRDFIPLETTVFNTEAHIFPRFKMGKLFKTGWERKHEWKSD